MRMEAEKTAPATDTDRAEPKLIQRLRERRETHKERGRLYRGAFVIAGIALTLAGIAMLVLPGPAFVVIPIGLAILSLEFTWAGRLLDKSLDQAQVAQQKAAETTTAQRIVTGLATACAAGALAAWAVLGDVPVLPV